MSRSDGGGVEQENSYEKCSSNVGASIARPQSIKYVITLDADTDLILGSAFELVGAMAHILNRPVIDEQKNIVVDGYGIIQQE